MAKQKTDKSKLANEKTGEELDETVEGEEVPADEPEKDDVPQKDETKLDDDVPADEPAPVDSPYGQQIMQSIHAGLADLIEQATSALGPLENPDVKAALEGFLTNVSAELATLEGAFSSAYPKGKLLSKSDDGKATEEKFKSFLSSGQQPRFQLLGLSGRIKSVSASKNLTRDQKRVLDGVNSLLGGMVERAKSNPAVVPDKTKTLAVDKTTDGNTSAPDDSAAIELFKSLNSGLDKVTKSFNDAMPVKK